MTRANCRVRLAVAAGGIALIATLAALVARVPAAPEAGPSAPGFPPSIGPARPVASDTWRLAPRFSPDGRWIVAAGSRYAGLWIIDPEGLQPPRQVTDEDYTGFAARWTAAGIETRTRGGRDLVFADPLGVPSRRDAGVRDPRTSSAPIEAWAEDDAILVRRDGAIRTVSDGADRYFGPVPSPDGTAVVYEGLATGLHVHDLVRGETLHAGPGNHPAWLPDSSGLVYDVSSDDGRELTASDLWALDRRTGRVARLTATPDRLEASPSVSPDGTRVAFEAAGTIYVAPLVPADSQ